MDRTSRFLLPDHLATQALDRLAERRRDAAWLATQLQAGTTRFVPIWQSKILVDAQQATPVFLPPADAQAVPGLTDHAILLGRQDDRIFFAVDLTDDALPAGIAERGRFTDLRQVAPLLAAPDCALLSLARAMVFWHRHRRFCGDCGSPTASRDAGFMRACTDPDCGRQHFPRTDPAIIVLVTAGERCLLGRQATWPRGLRSTLAGFVEPGETLEGAVAREVHEETGIKVTDIRYSGSQPWPFPTSLMLGFTARALDTAVQIDAEELEEAAWFTREQIRNGIMAGSIVLPSSISIALRLMRDWFDAGECGLMAEISTGD